MAMGKRQYLSFHLESGRDGLITFFLQRPRRPDYLLPPKAETAWLPFYFQGTYENEMWEFLIASDIIPEMQRLSTSVENICFVRIG